jgi:hypothetical protein
MLTLASLMPMPGGPYQRPPDVPKSARDEPLPHDGLFIRRNNAFGTKSTLDITDLIEQGVLIDQTQIRFDDFIASRSDGIPLPQAGEAMAVSHGYAAAPSVANLDRSSGLSCGSERGVHRPRVAFVPHS